MQGIGRTGGGLVALVLLVGACGDGTDADDASPPADGTGEPASDEQADPDPGPDDEEPVVEDGQLQPLSDGFPNAPITFLVEDDPGSGDSIYASQLQDRLRDIAPVRVNVEHRGDFGNLGTWEAIAYMNGEELAQQGNVALVVTIPGFVTDALVVDMEAELGLTTDDINGIAITEQIPYVVHQNVDAPWGQTMEQMIEYCQQNPGEVRYISGGPGSGQDVTFRYYMSELDCEVQTIIGGGQEERALAVAAGEGDVTLSPQNIVLPFFDDGRVVVTMVGGDEPAQEPWADAPNAADLGIDNDPFLQSRGLVAASDLPEANLRWLTELVRLGSEDPGFKEDREGQVPGLNHAFLSGEEIDQLIDDAYDAMLPVIQEQGIYHGDG